MNTTSQQKNYSFGLNINIAKDLEHSLVNNPLKGELYRELKALEAKSGFSHANCFVPVDTLELTLKDGNVNTRLNPSPYSQKSHAKCPLSKFLENPLLSLKSMIDSAVRDFKLDQDYYKESLNYPGPAL